MNVFVTSDTFFGRQLAATNGGFSSLEEMEDRIIENWNERVKKNDVVYHLGNFSWDPISGESALSSLNGTIFFVGGSYDKHMSENSLIKIGRHKLLPPIAEVTKLNTVFSHWPLADWENRGEGAIHVHGGQKPEERIEGRFCANIANWSWNPIELDFLKELIQK